MCGVFGLIQSNPKNSTENAPEIIKSLMAFSQARGQDSSGVATWSNSGIHVIKRQLPAEKLSKTPEFNDFVKRHISTHKENDYFMMIGNCRLATDGDTVSYDNSQPFIDEGIVLVHNGLIVNKNEIYASNPELKKNFDIDTEVLADLFAYYFKKEKNPHVAIKKTFSELRGTSSSAFFVPGRPGIAMGSNNGSLYYRFKNDKENLSLVFASESYALAELELDGGWSQPIQVFPNSGIVLGLENNWSIDTTHFENDSFEDEKYKQKWQFDQPSIDQQKEGVKITSKKTKTNPSKDLLKFDRDYFVNVERCKKCILPSNFPFITFDDKGVCSHCNNYEKQKLKGEKSLVQELNQGQDGGKIILALSGGRDSCYALHYLVKDLNLPVIAYTYDWGAVTPLARRNMSIMCGELGIEHILIAADIDMKRRNIRKNVQAWLKRPNLGAVPLFMAGDKQFFYYAQKVKKQNKGSHLVFGMNPLERTDFKIGFCGIKNENQDRHYNLNYLKQLKMIAWYGREFLLNPSYINESLLDTAFGFWSYYLSNHEYNILYQYIPWNEKTVNDTLISQYGWETAEDTSTTWRIGDGTASFYNYIYASLAGFTESDTFRSNQVREGHISREEAMRIMLEENQPRFDSINWYCETMGLDYDSTIKTINKAAERGFYGQYED